MIYLDNAATTAKKPDTVAQAVYEAISGGNLGNPARGAHDYAVNAFRKIYAFREGAARFFGVLDPLNIALVLNATDGLNRVLKGYFKPGDHVISTVTEHNSVLRPLYQLEEMGLKLDLVGINEKAELNYKDFEKLVRPETKAVVVTAASNVTGNPTNLEFIAAFCKKHNLKFFLDASQAAGIFDLDLEKQGIDVLVATGHKSLYGPQGTGIVAVRDKLAFAPVFSGGAGTHSFERTHPALMPDVMESGTLNTPGAAGLTAGIEYVESMGLAVVRKKLERLSDIFAEGLSKIPGIKVYGDLSLERRAPVIGINIGEMPSSEAAAILNEDYGIAVRPGAHCAPRIHEALGTVRQGILRFSFSTFNTEDEIRAALTAIKEISEQTGGHKSIG